MFDSNRLRPLFGSIEGSAKGFLYTSEYETPALIDGADYFVGATGHNIELGDFIFLQQGLEGQEGSKYTCHRVTAINGANATTTMLCGVYSHSGQQLWDALRVMAAMVPLGD